ncbi:hypothetical protein [Kitasatospora sp. NPDC097643]|uniref:hypothetical protein n=1 Tax=Kitasatospora sp. NPDC097643 TaxID=3157230 RepID=UPI00331AACCB
MTNRTIPSEGEQTEAYGLCLVANVAQETAHGPDGLDLQRGLRHFAPGAKLWIAVPRWDFGDGQVIVAGRHRGNGRRYVTLVTNLRHLENFRVQGVYSPALLRALTREAGSHADAHGLWPEEWAEQLAASCNLRRLRARVPSPVESSTP